MGQSAESLRLNPIGKDRLGHTYWLTKDNDCNVHIYQEHLDEEIWRVVAKNRTEFVNLIQNLKNNEKIMAAEGTSVIEGEEEDDDVTNTTSTYSADIPKMEQVQPEFLHQAVHTPEVKDVFKKNNDDDEGEEEEEYDFVQKVPNLRIKLGSGCGSDLLNNDLTILDASSELPLRLLKSPSIDDQQHIEDDSSLEAAEEGANRNDGVLMNEELSSADMSSKDSKVMIITLSIIIYRIYIEKF